MIIPVFGAKGCLDKLTFRGAHTAYWSARGIFSSAIVKSFVKAYKFQYDEKYQNKVLKKNSKKSEL